MKREVSLVQKSHVIEPKQTPLFLYGIQKLEILLESARQEQQMRRE